MPHSQVIIDEMSQRAGGAENLRDEACKVASVIGGNVIDSTS